MASDTRARARRSARNGKGAKAAKGAKANGSTPAKPPAADAGGDGGEGGGSLDVDAIIAVLVKRDGANTQVDVAPQGDVRVAELPSLLEVATKRAREMAGLD